MNDRDWSGAIVVLVGGALALGAAQLGDRVVVPSPSASDPRLLVVVVAAALAVVGLGVARRRVVGRALGRRVRVQMVPTDAFDPSREAVIRFASGLVRTRRVVFGLLDGPASAARIRLHADEAGRLIYEVEVPGHASDALRTNGYDDVEQHDPDDEDPADGTTADCSRSAVARLELVLARPSTEPLRDVGLDPDPLVGIARAMEGTYADARVAVCVDLLPVSAAARLRLRRRLLRRARRRTEAHAGAADMFPDVLPLGESHGRQGGAPPADLVQRRASQRALVRKLGAPEPLFRIQVLIRATAATPGRAIALAQGAAAAFDAFAGENHFRAVGLRLPGGVGFFGADGWLRRRRFDHRVRTGLFRPARRRIVTASEVAGLLKPPSVHCAAANVVRSGGLIPPPPPGLPTFSGQPDLLPLGRVRSDRGARLVGVPLRDTYFAYMGGRSRWGKTETALGQFLHLARSGHGCFLLDPHEDAIQKAKAYLTDAGLRERVIEINLADQRQPGWNPLAVRGLPAQRRAERVDAVVDAFAAAMNWGEQNTRALNLVTQAAQALTELAVRLPAPLAPTLLQIPALLGNDEWRAAVLPYVAAPTRQFFVDRFSRLSSEAITPVTNLIDRLRVSPPVAALLGAAVSTYDARAAMDRGMIVLACPGTGSTRDRVVANLLVYDLLHQAKTRADLPPEQRRPFHVFLDEVQTYDGGADTLAALLEQAAKYGIRAHLFNQNPERLSKPTWNAVSTNRSHLSSTALASKAAALLAREWAGAVAPEVITRLERFTYLSSVTLNMQVSPPFLVHGVPVEELLAGVARPDLVDALERTIDHTIQRRHVSEVTDALSGHETAIRDALSTQPAPDPDETPEVHELGGKGPQR